MDYLKRTWQEINAQKRTRSAPTLIHRDLTLAQRVLRDMVTQDTQSVICDNPDTLHQLQDFAQTYMPSVLPRLKLAPVERPLFDTYEVEEEINRLNTQLAERTVWGRKVGGSLPSYPILLWYLLH